MLEPAYLHRNILPDLCIRAKLRPDAAWYSQGAWNNYEIQVAANDWAVIQRVSVGPGGLYGMLTADIDRDSVQVSELGALTFKPGSATFARDLARFMAMLILDLGMERIGWSVLVGNPAEVLYDHAIARYGGRVVGVQRRRILRPDRTFVDRKSYEIIPSELTPDQRARIATLR